MVNSMPIIIRSRRANFPRCFRDLAPMADTSGDEAAMAIRTDSPFET
jgi:hypothetical protein